jgi:hypothetical protein
MSLNPGTVYLMDVSDASYYIRTMKIRKTKVAKWTHQKCYVIITRLFPEMMIDECEDDGGKTSARFCRSSGTSPSLLWRLYLAELNTMLSVYPSVCPPFVWLSLSFGYFILSVCMPVCFLLSCWLSESNDVCFFILL